MGLRPGYDWLLGPCPCVLFSPRGGRGVVRERDGPGLAGEQSVSAGMEEVTGCRPLRPLGALSAEDTSERELGAPSGPLASAVCPVPGRQSPRAGKPVMVPGNAAAHICHCHLHWSWMSLLAPRVRHPFLGDLRKLITDDFVKQK